MIDKNEILKAIADKHNVIVREDDPIFTVFAAHDAILEENVKIMAMITQKFSDELIANIQPILEKQHNWIKQENETFFKYHGQIARDAHIQFDRSIDDTINTIKKWHLEIVELRTSTWMAAIVTIVMLILGCYVAAAMNIGR